MLNRFVIVSEIAPETELVTESYRKRLLYEAVSNYMVLLMTVSNDAVAFRSSWHCLKKTHAYFVQKL